ncbi:hypothetical protein [Nocardioides sp. Soil805]|uniref:hypothetical protein n=1 Tax=Nocardioides sp. Soil805 TaxID=1736416 RepID=UPI0012E34C77|nr:hypothetical protein [Nocardioides sp. Soil805]
MTTPATPLPIDVSVAPAVRGTWLRGGWPPLLAALTCAAAYLVFLALPYRVEALAAHPMVHRGGQVTFLVGPAVALGTLAWSAVRTRQGIAALDVRRAAPALVGTAVSVGILAWLFSPSGRALMTWFLG